MSYTRRAKFYYYVQSAVTPAGFSTYWVTEDEVLFGMKNNVAGQTISSQMIAIADGSDFTGAVTVTVTIDGGTQTAGGGTVTHEGNGEHSYAPTQAETAGTFITFSFSGTGAITRGREVYTTFPQAGDNYARLGAPVGASVSADNAAIKVDTAATLVDTNDLQTNQGDWLTATGFNTVAPDNAGITANGVAIAALNNITAADVLAAGDIDGYSLEEAQKLILSSGAGILAGAATNTITIQAADGSKTRLTATVDVDGNRSAVVKDATG